MPCQYLNIHMLAFSALHAERGDNGERCQFTDCHNFTPISPAPQICPVPSTGWAMTPQELLLSSFHEGFRPPKDCHDRMGMVTEIIHTVQFINVIGAPFAELAASFCGFLPPQMTLQGQ